MDSKAALAVLYINGKDTTTEAKIAEYHIIDIFIPKFSSSQEPIILLVPKSLNKKYPITVGGKTKGNVNITSRKPRIINGSFDAYHAAVIPIKKTIKHEIKATLSELNSGNKSIIYYFAIKNPTDSKISFALSENFRNKRKFLARDSFFEFLMTAAGYITGVFRVPVGGSAIIFNL